MAKPGPLAVEQARFFHFQPGPLVPQPLVRLATRKITNMIEISFIHERFTALHTDYSDLVGDLCQQLLLNFGLSVREMGAKP